MAANVPAGLLNDAFNVFKDASKKLEKQYAMLEERIEELNSEIAEKNRTAERTKRLAAMGEMAAKIAHEIRNPLGSMAIFATLLERELSGDPEKKRLAGHITKGIKTLDNLLSNMLLFATSPSARLKPVDLREIIEDALLMTRGHERSNVRIKTVYEGPTRISGDQGLLRQLFLNLFLNALDAITDGGLLRVATRIVEEKRRYMEITVKDTGRGIEKENLERIFDPFFSTKERGTGLGLAIVSTVANAHGGFVDVSSEAGSGSVFTIGLPLERGYMI